RHSTVADKALGAVNGYPMLFGGLIVIIISGWLIEDAFASHGFASYQFGLGIAGGIVALVLLTGLIVLQPNESLVCLLFGSYVGTERRPGFWWVNPFNSKRKVSRRLETLECGPLKVNDAIGNPVDIGAVVVWRVEDAAKAVLEVGSYQNYVKAQSETALRRFAGAPPCDYVGEEERGKKSAAPQSHKMPLRTRNPRAPLTTRHPTSP